MKKLNSLKNRFAKERLSAKQASCLKGGDDKRKDRPIDPTPLPGTSVELLSTSIQVTVSGDIDGGG